MEMTPQAWPDWYDGRHINEVLFCQQFLDKHPMKCVRGRLFTVDGLISIGYFCFIIVNPMILAGTKKSVLPFKIGMIVEDHAALPPCSRGK